MQPVGAKPIGRGPEPKIVFLDEHHATGMLNNVLFTFSKSEPTRAFLDSWTACAKQAAAEHEQIAALIVIDSDAKPPSDAIRAEIHRTLLAFGGKICAIAQIVEGKGFMAAAKRSALSMVALLARFPFPLRIFGETMEGAVWLAVQLPAGGVRFDTRALCDAAESVRQAHRARR